MQHDFVVCVVGLSNNPKEPFATRPGVGKSCLCFRFTYPGYDRYIDTHPSILALHEFGNPVINNTHFLYWGSPLKTYPLKGGDLRVRYHLLEHTVFYQDITSRPFNALTHPDDVNYYLKRVVGSIESSGKHSYYSRDDILSSDAYKKLQYPSNLSKQMRGYIVVFDVSLAETELEMQCKRVVPILEFFTKTKRKFVIAATKRDAYKIMSLERLRELQRKFHVPLVETSANENLNVDEVFRILAKQVLGKRAQGLTDQVQSYDEAARFNLHCRGAAKRAFLVFMKKNVTDCDERLDSVETIGPYQQCMEWIGHHQAGSLFVHHQLGLYNVRVDSYAGVIDDPVLRREFLEGFVDGRYDTPRYKIELRRWIDNYIDQIEQMLDSNNHIEPYQIFQKGPEGEGKQEGGAEPEVTVVPEPEEGTVVPEPEESPSTAVMAASSSNSLDSLDDHAYLNYDPNNPSLHQGLSMQDSEQVLPDPVSVQLSSVVHPDAQAPPTVMRPSPPPLPSDPVQTSSPPLCSPSVQPPPPLSPDQTSPPPLPPDQTSPQPLPPDPVQTSPQKSPPPLFSPSVQPPPPLPPDQTCHPSLPPDTQAPTPAVQTFSLTGEPDSTHLTGEPDSTQQDSKAELLAQLKNEDLDHSPQEGHPGNETGGTENQNGTRRTGNGTGGTENQNGTRRTGNGTDGAVDSAEMKRTTSPPPVLPKPKQKPQSPTSSSPVHSPTPTPGSPTTRIPRGKAPPPPVRSSSVTASDDTMGEPVGSPAGQHKMGVHWGNSDGKEDKTSEERSSVKRKQASEGVPASPTTYSSMSLGRTPSRVAPPPPAAKRAQSPILSPTRKMVSSIPAKVAAGSKSSSGTSSPILTPSHSVSAPQTPLSPHASTVAGGEGDKDVRPKLSMIRQKLAEMKEPEEPQVESMGGGRLAKIRKRLATQKKSSGASDASVPTLPVSPPLPPTAYVAKPPPLPPPPPGSYTLSHPQFPDSPILRSLGKEPNQNSPLRLPSPPLLPSPSLGKKPLTSAPPSVALPPSKKEPLPKCDDSDAPPLPTRTVAMLEITPKPKPKPRLSKAKYFNVVPDGEAGKQTISEAGKPTISGESSATKTTAPEIATVVPKPKKDTRASLFSWATKNKSVSPKISKEKVVSPKRADEKSQMKKGSVSPEKTASPEVLRSRANFLNMRVRPLPSLPGHNIDTNTLPDHSEDDYEPFSMGTMDDSYINYPPGSRGASSVRRWSSFGSNDMHATNKAAIPNVRSLDIPDNIDDYVNANDSPRQSSSKGLVGIDRRPLPMIPVESSEQDQRQVVKGNEEEEEEERDEKDYDYPNLHGAIMFRSIPATKEWVERLREKAKVENIPRSIASLLHDGAQARLTAAAMENQAAEAGVYSTYSDASSDYVPMDGQEESDYINASGSSSWLPRHTQLMPEPYLLATTSQQQQQQQQQQTLANVHAEGEAADDITVYMNLPTPERVIVPPPSRHMNATLPREKTTKPAPPVAAKKMTGALSDNTEIPTLERTIIPPHMHATLPQEKTAKPAPPVAAKKMTKFLSDNTKIPPEKLPKPGRTEVSPSQISSLDEREAEPPRGWVSPSQSNQLLFDADYQNIDCSQSLPLTLHALASSRRTSGWETTFQLPPRTIKRPPND